VPNRPSSGESETLRRLSPILSFGPSALWKVTRGTTSTAFEAWEPLLTLRWRASGVSDTGLRRAQNEDTLVVDQTEGVVIVADGMGGRPGGEFASSLAAKVVLAHLSSPEASIAEAGDQMAEAVLLANSKVWEAGAGDPERKGMGTTVTALTIHPDSKRWVIGHVGDSRGYLLRDDNLRRITRDHTVVQALVESGAISPSKSEDHPLGHLINRAVGTKATVEVDIFEGVALPGDIFLLCSDGLAGLVTDSELGVALQGMAGNDLDEKSAELIALAHERGAPDNVTLGFLAIEDIA
jgi:serine/threonine protein phosphatase PrpC